MKRRSPLLVLGPVILALGTGPAEAGSVTGAIDLPPRPRTTSSVSLYSKYCGHCNKTPSVHGDYAMVCLRARSGDPPRIRREPPVMDQKDTQFVPRVLPVQAGEQVRFLNSDPVFHNVFSLSPARKFDLGRYPKGDSRLIDFQDPGVVQVFCDIHAEMVGFIVVVDSPYFTTIDAAGEYRISDVPPGEYDVVVWAEGMTQFQDVGVVNVVPEGATEFTARVVGRP